MKLTKPQEAFLERIPDIGTVHAAEYYPPAMALVKHGIAYWHKQSTIALTPEGLVFKRDRKLNFTP